VLSDGNHEEDVPDNGDGFNEAFPSLFRSAYQAVFQLVGDRAAANDIAAETLTRAYARWWQLRNRSGGGQRAWVVLTATRLAIDEHRRAARTPQIPARDAPDVARLATERADLRTALSALPRRQRQVVVLRHRLDMTEQDVAASLGVSVGAVKQHSTRALQRLRLTLAEQEATETDVRAPS
jgi:RNA polymerase sigma factor (sigma-70 family)